MFLSGSKLSRLFDAQMSEDGTAIGFQIERRDGETFDVWCDLSQLNDLFYFLASSAANASERQTIPPGSEWKPRNDLTPIPADGIGFVSGRSPDETLLMLRLNSFYMGFAIPNSGLARLADDLVRIARTLSADPTKSN